jgi:uncharacterized damage-inducible protein DinB
MEEVKRISKLISDLYDGNSWIDVTVNGTLKNISATLAFAHPVSNLNSIWEIVNHLVSWREVVIKRLNGEVIEGPTNNFFEPIKDNSEEAWLKTLKRFDEVQQAWMEFMKGFDSNDLEIIYKNTKTTYYELILGILQHDAYHLGQIVLLKKLVNENLKQ